MCCFDISNYNDAGFMGRIFYVHDIPTDGIFSNSHKLQIVSPINQKSTLISIHIVQERDAHIILSW